MSQKPATNLPSEVNILRSNKAAKKGPGAPNAAGTITTWPKPEFGAGTTIDNVTKAGKTADGFIVPAGSMFPLGCAIPNHTVLEYGMYFPPGTMFPDGVLVPIHARMVSVQPIQLFKLVDMGAGPGVLQLSRRDVTLVIRIPHAPRPLSSHGEDVTA